LNIQAIQTQLQVEELDGWLFFDHHCRDPIAYRVLGLPRGHVSRRWFYWIPARGEPRKLVHRIESQQLDALPGEKAMYASWGELQQQLAALLGDAKNVAMQYSPDCMIPYVSLVDAGTVDSVRKLGVEVRSSGSLVQHFEARWSPEQLEMHLEAGRRVDQVRDEAFQLIGKKVREQGGTDELTIAEFIRRRFTELELETDAGPIVGVNKNSGDPHYTPDENHNDRINAGDFVLIDLWAKLRRPRAVYYDVTWTGFCGADPPSPIQEVFAVVTAARDAAVQFVDEAIKSGRSIAGYEVDDVTRKVIVEKGYGDAFVHRTGHSIGEEVHGNGTNIDNLETHDLRPIIPQTCFSIEPGIYLPEFGVRSEIDCYVSDAGAAATGDVQTELIRIL
jgi:Xaa-Pro aminopeptidase